MLSLLLFPLAVNQVLPTAVDVLDGLFFVTTLAIPVVRYRLWAIDTVIRRSAAYALVTIAVVGGFAAIAAIGTAVASERVEFARGRRPRHRSDIRARAELQPAAGRPLLLRAAKRAVPGT